METKLTNTLNTWNENGETDYKDSALNISDRVKTFLWIWNKTGTSHMKTILDYFDFYYYSIIKGERKLLQKTIIQTHDCKFFNGHEDYKFMVSARNPYTRFLSQYRFQNRPINEKLNSEGFQKFLEEHIFDAPNNAECTNFHTRLPDYYVRTESLFEDYSKIPFIIETDLYKSGILKTMCEKKVNENPLKNDWRDFFTKEIADLIYYNTQEYFKFFGYDKNSWKI